MKYYMRVFGWLLIGFGIVLGGLGIFALAGVLPLQIDFFGINLETRPERIAWTLGWLVAATAGATILRFGR